jgi:uncharacterized protein
VAGAGALSDEARRLVEGLGLLPHPEGGYYREVWRSGAFVEPHDGRPVRAALTSIYFLLAEGDVSRWHRVLSDEAWHFIDGAPLRLLTADATFGSTGAVVLGRPGQEADAVSIHVVAGGRWQAAESTGAWTLVGCTVGPGFDFGDFVLLRDEVAAGRRAAPRDPELARFV